MSKMKPSQGFWGTGEQGHLFKGNRGTKAKCCGEQGNKDNIGEQGTQETNFRILGSRGTSQFISGEQGNRYPHGTASKIDGMHNSCNCKNDILGFMQSDHGFCASYTPQSTSLHF